MQFLMNYSKYVIFSVLSCLLAVVFYGANTSLLSRGSIDNYDNSSTLDPNDKGPELHVSDTASSATPATEKKKDQDTIWNSLNSDFSLDHKTQSPQVKTAIRVLLADKQKLYQILESAEPYIYYIHQQTRSRGLPAELALIPAIESEFNPNDFSNKGATGLWQLMPQTAHELGIKVKSNYDGRRNVIASTNAALAYFRDLGVYFKQNWYLAIAAYNCGQGKVDSAMHRAGSRNFWNLKLPHETRAYIPKLLAIAAIIQNPEKYGIRLPHIHNKPYFSAIQSKQAVSLTSVAKSTGVSMDTLYALNPDYKHGPAPSYKSVYTLLVPVKYASALRSRVAKLI